MRMTQNNDLMTKDPIVQSILETGGSEIAFWEVNSTGTSSGTETEIDAPDAEFDGSAPLVADITCKTKTNSIGSQYLTWIADDDDGTTTTHYFWWSKPEISTVTCIAKDSCVAESTFHFHAGDDSEFYVWINKAGTDSDPSETGTAIEADISGDTTAGDVASTVATAINANVNFGASATDEVVTITNAANGNATDINETEGEATGFTLAVSEQGGSDPSATGTGHEVDISSDTTATNVADALATVMTGVANITATNSSEVVTAENDNYTATINDPTDSGTFATSISVTLQGTDEYAGNYVYIVGTSANDDDGATKHVRAVTLIGFDDNQDPCIEEVRMNGTTHVKTSNKFTRINHMYASDFGSGGSDAADAITLVSANTGNGDTYLTIAQNGTESNGAKIYIPTGNYMAFEELRLMNLTVANTGSTIVKAYLSGFGDYLDTDSDFDWRAVVTSQYNTMSSIDRSMLRRTSTNTSVITFKEREVGTSGNEDYTFNARILTYQK